MVAPCYLLNNDTMRKVKLKDRDLPKAIQQASCPIDEDWSSSVHHTTVVLVLKKYRLALCNGWLFAFISPDSFTVISRELCEEEKELVHFQVCEGTSQSEPSCSAVRITGNKNFRSKAVQESDVKKMQEEEHHQQMSILQLQLIQMNEVHVAKIQQIERECEMAEEEHRSKMEVLNKKKMYWERKLQTVAKEWPVASFNRPFPNSP